MNKLIGVFENFRYLDQIPTSDISKWLKTKINDTDLENFIGNRIIYPQTLPMNSLELEIDLAIFREALKRQPEVLYDRRLNKIIIPGEFQQRFGTFERLIKAITEVLILKKNTKIYLKEDNNIKLIGSI